MPGAWLIAVPAQHPMDVGVLAPGAGAVQDCTQQAPYIAMELGNWTFACPATHTVDPMWNEAASQTMGPYHNSIGAHTCVSAGDPWPTPDMERTCQAPTPWCMGCLASPFGPTGTATDVLCRAEFTPDDTSGQLATDAGTFHAPVLFQPSGCPLEAGSSHGSRVPRTLVASVTQPPSLAGARNGTSSPPVDRHVSAGLAAVGLPSERGALSDMGSTTSSGPRQSAERRGAAAAARPWQGGKGAKGWSQRAVPSLARSARPSEASVAWRAHAGQELGAPEELALLARLQAGGEERKAAMAALRGQVRRLALEPFGCRLVQQALQVADQRGRLALVAELRGHVREAMDSPHGNYVVQEVVKVMPTTLVSFVAKELASAGAHAARHRYGCRIVCRLLEHTAADEATAALVDEILADAADLSRHVFGHHVIKSALEHGLDRQRLRIARALMPELMRNARNRNSSYVIEAALTHCPLEGQQAIAAELLRSPSEIAALAHSQFGHHVMRALLRLPGEESATAMHFMQKAAAQLAASKHGRRLLEDLRISYVGLT